MSNNIDEAKYKYAEGSKTLLTCDPDRLTAILAQAEYLEKGELLDILAAVILEARDRIRRVAVRSMDDEEIDRFIAKTSNCFRGCHG